MRRFWTEPLDNLLRRHYPKGDLDALAARIGVSRNAVKSRASKLGLKRKVNAKQPWTERQLAYLRAHYADTPMSILMERTRHKRDAIESQAHNLGLRKSREYLAELGRRAAARPEVIACRFKKGMTPHNKGKREEEFRSPEAIERCRRTQFKPGQLPHNTKPVGYEHTDRDGYILVKVADRRKMVHKHRYVWEQAHGPIPRGHNVMFRDGNRQNCSLDNLYLLSREEAGRRQVHSETPQQRAARCAKANETRNLTIRRDKIRIHWGLEPKTKLVKRW